MRQLKQNLFWVCIGLAVAVLAAFYVLQVMPQYGERSTKQRAIKGILLNLKGDIPGDPDIAAWNAYKDQLKKDYSEITKFYEDCDAHLERWFGGLPDQPPRDGFMTRYRDEMQAIENKLKQEKHVKIGTDEAEGEKRDTETKKTEARGGFNWEEPRLEDWDKITQQIPSPEEKTKEILRVLKILQKRFWARQRVANVVLEGKANVSRILNFHFLRRLSDKITNPPWEDQIMQDPVTPFAANTVEYDLPDGLGKTITFRFGVELPFSEVPKFIQEFLNPSTQAGARERLLLSVPECRVTIRSQNEPEKTITYEEGNLEQKKQEEEKAHQQIAARNVLLIVTCRVIDFDGSKVKKFDEGQPAP